MLGVCEMNALAHVGNFGIFTLTVPQGRSNYYTVAAKSATGIGVPNLHGATAPIERCPALFSRPAFVRARACQFYGGRCVGAARPTGSVCPVRQPAPSATPIGVGEADSNQYTESRMSYDAQEAPAAAARQIAHYFGLIANTLEWNHAAWLSLMARLGVTGKAIHTLTLSDVETAIAAVDAMWKEAQR